MRINKILLFVIVVLLLLCFSGCNGSLAGDYDDHDNGIKTEHIDAKQDYPLIVTTIFPAYDFVREITGGVDNVKMLIKPGGEVHTYEPSPQDIQLINDCDVFIYVGGESDSWIDGVLDAVDNQEMRIVKMMECVENIPEEHTLGMQIREGSHQGHSHEADEHHIHQEEYDEHVWTSPMNAIAIVQAITDALCETDNDRADKYKQNANEYIEKLSELDAGFRNAVRHGKRNTVIFGDRFPLLHFAKEYGIEYFAAYPGCTAESEPNAKTLAFLIEKTKEEKIPVIFHIELSNERMADTICEETGAEKMLFSSCHNLPAQQFNEGITYLDLMNNNLTALRKALN